MARCLYTFVQLGAGVGPGNVEGATLPQSEAPRCTVERFRTTMKTSISIVLGCSLVAFAAGPFVTDKTDPAAAGMNPARLARDSGLGAALFDALDLIGGHAGPPGQFGDTETQGAALVVDRLAEGQGLADGDPLRILGLLLRADPAGVVTGHHTCLS